MQNNTVPADRPLHATSARRWRARFLVLLFLLVLSILIIGLAAYTRFGGDTAVTHANEEDHFKYGSMGGERESGFPYWIFQALPQVCGLQGGYRSLGMIYEGNNELPVGMSQRRLMGLDRTFLNCAVCHTSTVRDTPEATPRVVTGMPANTFNLMGFEQFLFDCAINPKFSTDFIIPEVRHTLRAKGADLDLVDRYVVYPLAVWIMRERLLMLRGRFSFVEDQARRGLPWGPGRVDTFNSAKVLFNFPMHRLDPKELLGASDFPSIWNQRGKQGMQLHWDGNNDLVEERNKNAAYGTGATPPTLDLAAIGRIEAWLLDRKPPPYPFPIDKDLAARGAPIYQQYCSNCHGANGQDFTGPEVGKVTPLEQIGTDPRRLDSFTYTLAVNLATPYAGYPHRFSHFRKTYGYANLPLDGLWVRAPYLHNGSVPTLFHLLEPSAQRPAEFYRGNDLYDSKLVGFAWETSEENGRRYFRYDTRLDGNTNAGHEGRAYGTQLPAQDKSALLEFLKTF